jgi:hypothetical protein
VEQPFLAVRPPPHITQGGVRGLVRAAAGQPGGLFSRKEVFLTSVRPSRLLLSSAFNAVHGDPAQKLGVKVGRFLRQDFAGGGDTHHLLHVARVQ